MFCDQVIQILVYSQQDCMPCVLEGLYDNSHNTVLFITGISGK